MSTSIGSLDPSVWSTEMLGSEPGFESYMRRFFRRQSPRPFRGPPPRSSMRPRSLGSSACVAHRIAYRRVNDACGIEMDHGPNQRHPPLRNARLFLAKPSCQPGNSLSPLLSPFWTAAGSSVSYDAGSRISSSFPRAEIVSRCNRLCLLCSDIDRRARVAVFLSQSRLPAVEDSRQVACIHRLLDQVVDRVLDAER